MTRPSLPRSLRLALIAVTCTALVAASGLVLWRVLRPTEVVTPATSAYPPPVVPAPGAIGALISAPLIVGDRIRVFAGARQVWSDAPPNYRYERSAFWSYRRWPAQVVGVVVPPAPRSGPPIVVTAWSDGELVGLDARTGKIAWRVRGEALGSSYAGRRTGADTVYRPAGLFTGVDSAGRAVVVAAGPESTRGYDPRTGQRLWSARKSTAAECRGVDFTAPGRYLWHDTCTGTLHQLDLTTGTTPAHAGIGIGGRLDTGVRGAEPVSCTVGHSQCPAVRTTTEDGVQGWVLLGSTPTVSAALAAPGSVLLDGVVVVADNPAAATALTARDAMTDQLHWTWHQTANGSDSRPPALIGTSTGRVLLLTPGKTLIAVSSGSGRELSRASITLSHELTTDYQVAQLYTAGRFVVLERALPTATPDQPDPDYYFTPRPILLTAS